MSLYYISYLAVCPSTFHYRFQFENESSCYRVFSSAVSDVTKLVTSTLLNRFIMQLMARSNRGAAHECEKLGAQLVSVESREEQLYLHNVLRKLKRKTRLNKAEIML